MRVKSGRKKGATQKILDMLPQDLVKSIVGKILERAEDVRNSLGSEEEPKAKIGRKAKKAVKSIKKTSKKVIAKAKDKAKKVKAKTTKKRK